MKQKNLSNTSKNFAKHHHGEENLLSISIKEMKHYVQIGAIH
jgi:hypothetical protein